MKTLEIIKTMDGEYFECERKALLHCENRMGEELDQLLKPVDHIGIQGKMAIMRILQAEEKQFNTLAEWVREYHEVKRESLK